MFYIYTLVLFSTVSQATNQEAGTSDDFENPPPSTKKKFVMDEALEDKLCDLYDIFVDVIKIFHFRNLT